MPDTWHYRNRRLRRLEWGLRKDLGRPGWYLFRYRPQGAQVFREILAGEVMHKYDIKLAQVWVDSWFWPSMNRDHKEDLITLVAAAPEVAEGGRRIEILS